MTGTNVVDLVARQVLTQIESQVEPRITAAATAAAEQAREAAERQIRDWLGDGGQVVLPAGDVPAKADARDRARRTAIQGAISTVVVGVLLAVAGVIGGNGFDFTNLSDWKAVGGAAIGAVLAVVTAYVHRLVSPPGSELKG